jgi:hypothetical protein
MKLQLIGQRFGRLVVKEELDPYVAPSSGKKTRKYLCECDCGNKRHVLQNALRSGASQSCGCYRTERIPSNRDSARGLRVGCDRKDPRYNVWSMMIQRCYEKNHDSYDRYGEAGKTVCGRWLEKNSIGFKNFCNDMGERPDGYKLDRRDNSLGYSPENCRWVNDDVSVFNRGLSKNNTSGVKGVVFDSRLGKWSARIGLNYKLIYLGISEDWFEAVCLRKSAELKYYKEYNTID